LHVLGRYAQAVTRGAAQVLGRGTQAAIAASLVARRKYLIVVPFGLLLQAYEKSLRGAEARGGFGNGEGGSGSTQTAPDRTKGMMSAQVRCRESS
jgi:hypothetical protein